MNGTKIVPLDAALAGAETPAVVPLSTAAVPTDGGDVLILGQGVVPGVPPALSLSVELSENAPRLSKIASRPNGAFLAVADMLHRGKWAHTKKIFISNTFCCRQTNLLLPWPPP